MHDRKIKGSFKKEKVKTHLICWLCGEFINKGDRAFRLGRQSVVISFHPECIRSMLSKIMEGENEKRRT
jgi:hypothetical protein